MKYSIYSFIAWILLKILSLRYAIEVKNLHLIAKDKRKGILFLPNHPAEIDPILILLLLAKEFHPRPLVIEHFYYLKGVRFFMNAVRALPLPNLSYSTNKWKLKQMEKCLKVVTDSLEKGENFIIYPSGHLKTEGHEVIGGNSFIHRILETLPDTRVILVRTTGLWGSQFSRAITGYSPDFWKIFFNGVKWILRNGIFFMPRRKVEIEFSLTPYDFPYKGTKLALNQALENWYNRYRDEEGNIVSSEPLKLVSLSRVREVFPKITKVDKTKKTRMEIEVPKEIKDVIYQELSRISGIKISEIRDDMDLSKDLGLDSLDLAQIQAFLDQKYSLDGVSMGGTHLVHDLFEMVLVEGRKKSPTEASSSPFLWPREKNRPMVQFPKGETIQEAFLDVCDRMGRFALCGDETTPIITYRKMKMGVLILARKFKKLPGQYVGVLLPSSVAAYLVIFALLLARKIPVMLNWTAGERSLNFADELLKLETVITARRFLERVDVLDLGILEDKLLILEDYKTTLSIWEKLLGFFLSYYKAPFLKKQFSLDNIDSNENAVILFTSGTENYPKAVPLSHKNLLSNIKAAIDSVKITLEDILYGVLPPFHSFGFSVTGLLPVIIGLRVFYSSDPTDSHKMAREIQERKITFFCSAPSFYRTLFRIAAPKQLASIRLFVSGSEAAPPELSEFVKKLGGDKRFIEGYGITECSPIVTLCRLDLPTKGVGIPLPGVEICIIHPETGEKVEKGIQGEICIHGPNVFQGYLGGEALNPFIELDGKKWYKSGDLGRIDEEGNLFLEGRIKRFVKIGGEMVSLASIEGEIASHAIKKGWIDPTEEKPQLAIGVFSLHGERPMLALITTFPLEKEDANEILRDAGFGRIVKIAKTLKVKQIPVTATGKVHYREINNMVLHIK